MFKLCEQNGFEAIRVGLRLFYIDFSNIPPGLPLLYGWCARIRLSDIDCIWHFVVSALCGSTRLI